jgi:hypothetical protein
MGSKISNTEWGLVIGAALMVDIMQILLNLMLIGPLINGAIDVGVGATLAFYFRIRGVKMDSKKIWGMTGTFLLEFIPIIDSLPLWCLDVVLTMVWDNRDKKKARESA